MQNGECWAQPTPSGILEIRARITSESVSGSVERVPTPTASMMTAADQEQARYAGNGGKRPSYQEAKALRFATPTVCGNHNRKGASATSGDGLATQVNALRWQTPVADDAVNRVNGKINSRGEPKLSAQVLRYPTPTAGGHTQNQSAYEGAPVRRTLIGLARDGVLETIPRYSTPTCRDSNSLKKCMRGAGSKEKGNEIIQPLVVQVGGALNPPWVEWLMGWPIGWTGCEALETARFQQWCALHGKSSGSDAAEAGRAAVQS